MMAMDLDLTWVLDPEYPDGRAYPTGEHPVFSINGIDLHLWALKVRLKEDDIRIWPCDETFAHELDAVLCLGMDSLPALADKLRAADGEMLPGPWLLVVHPYAE